MLFRIWIWIQQRKKIVRRIAISQAILLWALMGLLLMTRRLQHLWLGFCFACLMLGELAFVSYLAHQEWPTDIKE